MSHKLTRRGALLLPLAAAGCSTIEDFFGDSKTPLRGRREGVNVARRGLQVDAEARQVVVPPPTALASWPQPGGNATHAVGHVAVGGFNPAWRSSIGTGGGYRRRVTADPVVSGGRVITMDSDGEVASFALEDGSRQWRTDTQGEEDRSTNVGGGVSAEGNRVFAATGRGEVMALDAATGKIVWRKSLETPARSAPTVADGKLFVLTLDDRILAWSQAGERLWAYQAASSATTLFGQAAPAYADGFVVGAFGSGEIAALRGDSGALAWSDTLASSRGRASSLDLAGIRALPVVSQGRVFAIGAGGLLVSLDLRSGRRLWEREIGGLQTPWVAGDWLFVQTSDQTLAAIGRDDGRVRWVRDLPRYDNPEKRRGVLYWTGPVLAGGKLILAWSNETAVSVDPVTGRIIGEIEIRDVATVAPMAAANTLFILTQDGTLQAYR